MMHVKITSNSVTGFVHKRIFKFNTSSRVRRMKQFFSQTLQLGQKLSPELY